MEIIFLCQRVPYPPDRGDRITTFNVLKMLRQMGQVRVGCFQEHRRDQAGVAKLNEMGIQVEAIPINPKLRRLKVLAWLAGNQALTLPYFHSTRLSNQVNQWLPTSDLAFCYSSSMGQYLLGPTTKQLTKVIQFAELDSDKWRQLAARSSFPGKWIYNREARLLLPFEKKIAQHFDLSLVVSPVEKELFMQHIPQVEPMVVENGVDTDFFAPATPTNREEAVIFTGVMNYEPNVRGTLIFVQQSWPTIRAVRPQAQLFIVGSEPTQTIAALHGKNGITVTNRVAKTQPWFDRAQVAIAPLWIARGIQNKILEAMSMSLPVVATPAAFSGIDATEGKHLFLANNPLEFANHVITLLQNPDLSATMGTQARRHMKERYSWPNILTRLQKKLTQTTTPTKKPNHP